MSTAHLFPRTKGRRGLYVLGFANGEKYVGQTENIVDRCTAHRRTETFVTELDDHIYDSLLAK